MEPIEEEPFVIKDAGIKPKKKLGIKQKIGIACAVLAVAVILYPIMSIMMRIYNRSRYRDELFLQKDVAKYLEDRYDEEFIVVFNRGMSGAYNYVQLYARPITNKTQKIQIQGYYNKKGKLDYYDDYVMIKLTDDYEAYLAPIIDKYFDDYKFYMEFHSEWLTNDLPPDTKLEDLWKLGANVDYPLPTLYIYLAPKQGMSISIFKQLCLELREAGLRGRVKTWELQEEARYLRLDRNDWGDNYRYSDYDDVSTAFLYDNEIKIMDE